MIPPGPGARSIEPDDHRTVPTPGGSRAHEAHVAHSARLERRLYAVGDDAWCLVGNGLSNQTFVRGPEGIIAIDTGESIEEMRAAITELRTVCTDPIVAVCYTHFHYVAGTRAVLEAVDDADALPIWGHAAVDANRRRAAGEIAPTYLRGIVEQFAVTLPPDGEDGIVNVGLGLSWHRAEHAPFTPGYLPPTHTFDGPTRLRLAGLDVDVTPAPSDADDSVTLWFPALGLAVHNLVWPALFNVFAIRGEEYRDPRVLVRGIDHLRSLDAEHLIATHGPPLSGAAANADRITRVRDAIQFLWDQTVRWTNRGATSTELADLVVLPTEYDDDYLTAQLYGIVEHHTRQIRSGLFGFFDGDPQQLLPHAPRDRSARMIEAMGGADAVRARARAALDDDLRWALELAGILSAADDATDEDRALLATALRTVARRTSAANIRNWCLTRARELDGTASLDRFRTHRLARAQVLAAPLAETLPVLRVLVDPDRLGGIDLHLAVEIAGDRSGLHFRNSIACPTDGVGAAVTLHTDRETWADVLSGRVQLTDARTDGRITFTGDGDAAVRALAAVELPGLR